MRTGLPTLAVFASGNGTNFQSLAEASLRGELGGEIRVLLCDRADAPVIDRASRIGIEALTPPVGRYRSRIEDERPWLDALRERGVEFILLAGFMRRLHATLLEAFPFRILNIHPSLLPSFPGLDAIGQAFRRGVRMTGCTVHLVDEALDAGPILVQAAVPIRDDDSLETLEERMHQGEHAVYPWAVHRYLTEPWRIEGRRVIWERGAEAGVVADEPGGEVAAEDRATER
ncbi:MAG: phosphoribosylglycinamide formyltransferase [Candidatus Eisenbacteria bacterium]